LRLLFITRKFPPSIGGMETYSRDLYQAFLDLGVDVRLHGPGRGMVGRPSLLQMAGFFFSAVWTLLRYGRSFDALLLGDFALASLAPVASIASLGRIRVVVSLHGNDLYFMRKSDWQACVYRMLARCVVASGSIDAAVANSHAISVEAARHGIAPVTVIPLATSVPQAGLMVSERKPLVVFTSRLIRYKGLSWFVREVWPHLDPRLELVVAGHVWDADEHAAMADQPRIRYLGAVAPDALPALRASAIASIMPNRPPAEGEQDEGFGLVALEGPAVGTPTVASRCGGLPDAVAEGITGFLLPPLDASAWIDCLNDIANWPVNKRRAFAEGARAYTLEHYNWQRVGQRTLDVLQNLPSSHD
jgi:glycosyltransferase involved in cell wall biosynthesis